MKKRNWVLTIVGAAVLFVTPAKAVEVGIPFSFNDAFNIGARIHLSEFYAVQPSVGLFVEGDYTNFSLSVNNLFYLFQMRGIDQYVGAEVFLILETDMDNSFGLSGMYGLQYPITEVFNLFGEFGAVLNIQPNTFFSTFRTSVGVIFYPW
ncbi:hypothetical protein CHISP_0499 [Chitinispirillum alkaliphilum]|nr:hypothetical protein CHISP_0499 [Chitinispirillum alkaliphilum]